jgi:hypothetical protein
MNWEYFSFSGHFSPEIFAYPDRTVELIVPVSADDVCSKHCLKVTSTRENAIETYAYSSHI